MLEVVQAFPREYSRVPVSVCRCSGVVGAVQ